MLLMHGVLLVYTLHVFSNAVFTRSVMKEFKKQCLHNYIKSLEDLCEFKKDWKNN